jgi:hypothetical protein
MDASDDGYRNNTGYLNDEVLRPLHTCTYAANKQSKGYSTDACFLTMNQAHTK